MVVVISHVTNIEAFVHISNLTLPYWEYIVCRHWHMAAANLNPEHKGQGFPSLDPKQRKWDKFLNIAPLGLWINKLTSTTMSRTGCPAKFWLLCLLYVIALLNILVKSKSAITFAAITARLLMYPCSSPTTSSKRSSMRNPDDGKGNALTYWILSSDSEKLVAHSNIHHAPTVVNARRIPILMEGRCHPSLYCLPSLIWIRQLMDYQPSLLMNWLATSTFIRWKWGAYLCKSYP